MASWQEVITALTSAGSAATVFPARVKSVEGNTCTIAAYESEMEIQGVRLIGDPDAEEGVFLTPRPDSLVLVSAVEGDISNACILAFSEADTVRARIGGTQVRVDKDGLEASRGEASVSLRQNEVIVSDGVAVVSLSGGRASIKNDTASLLSVLIDLVTALNTFTVTTTTGPALPAPNSIAALQQINTKLNALLS